LPFLGPICHGLWTDLKVGEAEENGFKLLESLYKPIISWIKPGPPPISGPHRYIFMVWEQPAEFTKQKIEDAVGLSGGQEIARLSRMKWDALGFEKKLGLGAAITGNSFLV